MKGGAGIAQALAAEGVEVVFGLLGGGIDAIVHELVTRHGVRFVATRHEQAAVGMADGYSRATGRIGVALTTYGPGLANTGATMTAARLARSHVLLVTSDTAPGMRLDPMNFDQAPFILATAGAIQPAGSAQSLAEDVQLAFRHLRSGRGPIALNVPLDVSDAELPPEWSYDAAGLSVVASARPCPDAHALARVRELIDGSERPVLLAGRGATGSGAREALVALADRVGAVLATTLLAKGTFAGEPWNVGLAGGFAGPDASELLEEADLVLALGAGLNRFTTRHGKGFGAASLVQVDIDAARIGHETPVAAAVVADARATVDALCVAIEPRSRWRTPALAERIAGFDRWRGVNFAEQPGAASPYAVVRQLEELLPPDRILVVDIGLFMGPPSAHFTAREYVLPWQLGYVGGGLPAATGAALGRPDRLTVLFAGDGGIMAALADLDTCVRSGAPLLIVVMNDGGFGAERRLFRLRGEDASLADYPSPDVVGVASSLGLDAFSVTSAAQIPEIVASARIGEQPTLIDVRIDPEQRFAEMERAFGHG